MHLMAKFWKARDYEVTLLRILKGKETVVHTIVHTIVQSTCSAVIKTRDFCTQTADIFMVIGNHVACNIYVVYASFAEADVDADVDVVWSTYIADAVFADADADVVCSTYIADAVFADADADAASKWWPWSCRCKVEMNDRFADKEKRPKKCYLCQVQ